MFITLAQPKYVFSRTETNGCPCYQSHCSQVGRQLQRAKLVSSKNSELTPLPFGVLEDFSQQVGKEMFLQILKYTSLDDLWLILSHTTQCLL